MEAYAHGFYQRAGTYGNVTCRYYFLPRQDGILAHNALTLNAKCLVMLASVVTPVAARGAMTAVCIRIEGHHHTFFKVGRHARAHFFYHCAHLMAGHHGHAHHRVAAKISVEVGAAKAHIPYFN